MTENDLVTDEYRPLRWVRYFTGDMERQMRASCNLEHHSMHLTYLSSTRYIK